MTDIHNDLDRLKNAMAQATPKPDAARRAAVLAQAQQVFENHQRAGANSVQPSLWQRLTTGGGMWAGLGTGATALVAVAVISLPRNDIAAPPISSSAPPPTELPEMLSDAPFADSMGAAEVMEDRAIAPQAMVAEEEAEAFAEMTQSAPTARALAPDPLTILQAALEAGELPQAGVFAADALTNALAPDVAAGPLQHFAVPWSDQVVLQDSGAADDALRFQLIPSDLARVSHSAEPPAAIRFVITLTGFATLLETGETDLNGWTFADARALAQAAAADMPDGSTATAMALIESAAALAD